MTNLLLHSLADLEPLVTSVLDELDVGPLNVLEIGSELGRMTNILRDRYPIVTTVDPTINEFMWEEEGTYHQAIRERSLTYLNAVDPFRTPPHAAIIDGDHNHYTVSNELRLLDEWWERSGTENRLVILHDVGWPCGSRDMYYDPTQIPAESLHPHSWDLGVVWGDPTLRQWGFRGAGKYAISERWGEGRGVKGAVDQFLDQHPHYRYREIPSLFGLGFVWYGRSAQRAVARTYDPLIPTLPLLTRLEENRCRLYCEVLRTNWFQGRGR